VELGANILATEGGTKKHKNPTMNIIIKSSRREFIKKSGVIIAAASAFGTAGHLSATEKKEEEVSPPRRLDARARRLEAHPARLRRSAAAHGR
jgi:hypothetical protein